MNKWLKQRILEFIKNIKKPDLLTVLVVLSLALSFVGYSMSISNFDLYSPPDELYILWGDYFTTSSGSYLSTDNNVTDFPAWSVDYPYRAIFMGADYNAYASQKHVPQFYVVYSKNPVTSIFTFHYRDGVTRGSGGDDGYIRALFNKSSYNTIGGDNYDVIIRCFSGGEMNSGQISLTRVSGFAGYTYNSYNTIGDDVYFDFDFVYTCCGKHQNNSSGLSVSGLTSIPNVPYDYILECGEHGSPSSSGGGSSGGGSSGGGGSRPSWGSGDYGGGVGGDNIPFVGDGGGYTSRPDMELSVPDSWETPVEDNFDPDSWASSEYSPSYPPYIPVEGDTGKDGSSINWPSVDFGSNGGVSGEAIGFVDIQPSPDSSWGLIDVMEYYFRE